jgi:hypothetical protein
VANALRPWQRALHALVTRPLGAGDRTRRTPLGGRSVTALARQLVKPSATLAPLERVEIYNRMYWFRVLDSLAEDFPGLRALLGEKRFWALARRYLTECPSAAPSLRDLGRRLPLYLRRHPELAGPHAAAARDLAAYEWAQITAFDGAALPAVDRTDLAAISPARLRVQLQPSLTLLQLDHGVDEFWHAVKRGAVFRNAASNTVVTRRPKSAAKSGAPDDVRPPARGRVHLAVHRFDGVIYSKRLPFAAARVLRALGRGEPLGRAAARVPASSAAELQGWFAEWMSLGWLARR